jgi:adenylate kinase family enzyme
MARIDIIGPPGVGKSSFCHFLYKNRSELSEFFFDWEIRLRVAELDIKNKNILYKVAFPFAVRIPSFRNHLSKHFSREEASKTFLNLSEEWKSFIKNYTELLKETKSDPVRYTIAIKDFLEVMENVSLIEKTSSNKLVMYDESLTHRVYAISRGSDNWKSIASRYIENLELPAGVIYIKSDAQTVFNRIKRRSKSRTALCHLNKTDGEIFLMTEKSLQIFDYTTELINEKNIPIIKIDNSLNNKLNLKIINNFIIDCKSDI